MKSKIISLTLSALLATGIVATSVAPAVSAVDVDICSSSASQEVKKAAGCNTTNKDSANKLIINIINWVMGIIGMVAVVAIIIGGVQYMTSAGDPGKVKKAKDTILYAVIGLIIASLSAIIVNFVIDVATKDAPTTESRESNPQESPAPQPATPPNKQPNKREEYELK